MIDNVAFIHDANLAISRSWDGLTILWDAASGKEWAQLVSLNDGKDWLALMPEGLYDGSETGRGSLAFRVGGGLKLEPSQSHPEMRREGRLMSPVRGERLVPGKLPANAP